MLLILQTSLITSHSRCWVPATQTGDYSSI